MTPLSDRSKIYSGIIVGIALALPVLSVLVRAWGKWPVRDDDLDLEIFDPQEDHSTMKNVFAFGAFIWAALGLWLAIRVLNRGERWAKRSLAAIALLAVPVAYVASFGPACWAIAKGYVKTTTVVAVYRPLIGTSFDRPYWLRGLLNEVASSCNGYVGYNDIKAELFTEYLNEHFFDPDFHQRFRFDPSQVEPPPPEGRLQFSEMNDDESFQPDAEQFEPGARKTTVTDRNIPDEHEQALEPP